MKDKGALILFILAIIFIVAASVAFIASFGETHFEILSNSSLYNGEDFTLKLVDSDGNSLANKSVDVVLVASGGERNVLHLVTNSEGLATFTLEGVTPGVYTVECVYNGGDNYKACELAYDLKVEDNYDLSEIDSDYEGEY